MTSAPENIQLKTETSFSQAQHALNSKKYEECFRHMQTYANDLRGRGQDLDSAAYFLYSKACAYTGRFRQSIFLSRRAIALADSDFFKAQVYFQLAQIYRTTIRMKNQRLEIERTLEHLGFEFPNKKLWLLPQALWKLLSSMVDDSRKLTGEEHAFTSVAYQEASVSAYFQNEPFAILQAIFYSYYHAMKLGASVPLISCYAGTASVVALLGLHKFSNRLLSDAEALVPQCPEGALRFMLLKAVALEFQGRSLEATKISLAALKTDAANFEVFSMRPNWVTLLTSYTLRGHMREAVTALEYMHSIGTAYPNEDDSSMEWFALPALTFLNQIAEATKITQNLRAAFSMIDSEKWLVKYMSDILVLHIETDRYWDSAIDGNLQLVDRMKTSSRLTPFASFGFPIYKARLFLLRYTDALIGKVSAAEIAINRKKFKNSMMEISKLPKHPIVQSHEHSLWAQYYFLERRTKLFQAELKKAVACAVQVDNRWVEYDALILNGQFALLQRNPELAQKEFGMALELCKKWGWVLRENKVRKMIGQ